MTVRFGNNRLAFYIAVFLLSGAVLGLAAHLASVFLPSVHKDFSIFSLIVPSLTIFVFLLLLQWAQARIEAVALFILGVLWLATAAWATDVIGNTQCDSLGGQSVTTAKGSLSAQTWCREMKVIQAFSWMLFISFAIALVILVALVSRAQAFGRYEIWGEPIRELPWFGEAPGYYNHNADGGAQSYMAQYPGAQYPGAQYGHPQPGSALVIQPGVNGQMPTVHQVPIASTVG